MIKRTKNEQVSTTKKPSEFSKSNVTNKDNSYASIMSVYSHNFGGSNVINPECEIPKYLNDPLETGYFADRNNDGDCNLFTISESSFILTDYFKTTTKDMYNRTIEFFKTTAVNYITSMYYDDINMGDDTPGDVKVLVKFILYYAFCKSGYARHYDVIKAVSTAKMDSLVSLTTDDISCLIDSITSSVDLIHDDDVVYTTNISNRIFDIRWYLSYGTDNVLKDMALLLFQKIYSSLSSLVDSVVSDMCNYSVIHANGINKANLGHAYTIVNNLVNHISYIYHAQVIIFFNAARETSKIVNSDYTNSGGNIVNYMPTAGMMKHSIPMDFNAYKQTSDNMKYKVGRRVLGFVQYTMDKTLEEDGFKVDKNNEYDEL